MKEPNNFSNRFPGQRAVVFKCDMCGKLTRNTGDNGGVGLCPQCYSNCEEENRLSDFDVKCKKCGKQLYEATKASRLDLCEDCYKEETK